MNIYLREMKAHYKSVLIWAVAMFFLITAGITKYNVGVTTGMDSFTELMKDLPQSLQNLFGVGVLNVSDIVEYFGILYLYLQLVLAIQACMLGTDIITKEERDKTTEFLLVKPVSRTRIITAKILAGLTIVFVLNAFTWVSTNVILGAYTKKPYAEDIFHLMIALLALQILFFFLGTVIATSIKKYKLASPIATGILMIMFLLSVIIDISGKINFLYGLSFFKYYDAKDILVRGYHYIYAILTVILSIIFLIGTYYFYRKRDMRI